MKNSPRFKVLLPSPVPVGEAGVKPVGGNMEEKVGDGDAERRCNIARRSDEMRPHCVLGKILLLSNRVSEGKVPGISIQLHLGLLGSTAIANIAFCIEVIEDYVAIKLCHSGPSSVLESSPTTAHIHIPPACKSPRYLSKR